MARGSFAPLLTFDPRENKASQNLLAKIASHFSIIVKAAAIIVKQEQVTEKVAP